MSDSPQPDPNDRKDLVLAAVNGRRTRVTRRAGRALCDDRTGWYEREPRSGEERCQRCVEMSLRYGVEWPT